MTRLRLALLGLTVATLLAVVALVAHGRPLAAAAGKGSGLPQTFWDYVVTSMVILIVISWIGMLVLVVNVRRDPQKKLPPLWARTLVPLASIMAIAVIFLVFGRNLRFLHRGGSQGSGLDGGHFGGTGGRGHLGGHAQPTHLRWDEVAVVVGLLLALVAIGVATRRRPKPRALPSLFAPAAMAAALDESLDDLRSDPDLRRAIVAAYARMETALAAAGLPRRPAEAPLEYLGRSLLELDVDGPAVQRLTDLFEWARFSHHEPEPPMRDEAVDALVAIRDSLRAPAEAAA